MYYNNDNTKNNKYFLNKKLLMDEMKNKWTLARQIDITKNKTTIQLCHFAL